MASIESAAADHAGPAVPGRVARAEHSLVTVLTPAGPVRAGLTRREQACAGDYVLLSAAEPVVAEVLPRRSQLVRHAAGNRTEPQTLAANMDEVFVTVAADRDVSLGRIERFLALVWESGTIPVVVLTKGDLLPPGAAAPLLSRAAGVAPGADVHLVSAVTGDGVGDLARRLEPGRTAALIGSSGAGKSSLLNALAGSDRAIVNAAAGTTRDVLRESLSLDGIALELADTAGLRETDDEVEREGVRRAHGELQRADVALLVTDSAHAQADIALFDSLPVSVERLLLINKIDLDGIAAHSERRDDGRWLWASAKTGLGLDALRDELKQLAGAGSGEGAFSARRRHVLALQQVTVHLDQAAHALVSSRAGELAAEELRHAQHALGEITGSYSSDDLLGAIFGSFCIGK